MHFPRACESQWTEKVWGVRMFDWIRSIHVVLRIPASDVIRNQSLASIHHVVPSRSAVFKVYEGVDCRPN